MKWILAVLMLLTFAFSALPVQAAEAQDQINARCSAEWPSDYRMQKYCRKKQATGGQKVVSWMGRHAVKNGFEKTVWGRMFRHCCGEWTDEFGLEWNMTAYCLNRQEEAYRDL